MEKDMIGFIVALIAAVLRSGVAEGPAASSSRS